MKKSKFWIWFIPLFLIGSFGIYCMLKKYVNNNDNNNESNNSINIKELYSKNNNDYYAVNLSDTHVYKYTNNEELKELLNKNDGLIFIGDANNNKARKDLVVLNDVVSSTSVPQVFYINKSDINDELNKILKEKTNESDIVAGTLISVEKGNILKVFYPNYVLDNKELPVGERELLFDDYKGIVNKFIETCNEDC